MDKKTVIDAITRTGREQLPKNSTLLLYGSRARGDDHPESDWDVLILLDKPSLEASDYAAAYPFRLLGWNIGENINPSLYTKKQWDSWSFMPFHKNVEHDKIVLL